MTTFGYRIRTMIGFWNVRTLRDNDNINPNMNSKFLQVEREMLRYRISILGLSEVRWNGAGEYKSPTGDTIFLYSGKEIGSNHESGVGLLLTTESHRSLMSWKPISDRIITARFKSRVRNVSLIQCYAPTEGASEEMKDRFYGQLNAVYDTIPRGDIICVLGDLNAKVGSDNASLKHVMGTHGLGTRNDNGERFVEFCNARRMVIGGTLFQHKDCHKVTWRSSDQYGTANQIDHFAISRRFQKCLLDVRSKTGADIGQAKDHFLVIAKIRLRTSAILKKAKAVRPTKLAVERLKNATIRSNFSSQLREAVNQNDITAQVSVAAKWNALKDTIVNCANVSIGPEPKGRQPWMTDNTWDTIQERIDIKSKLSATEHLTPETKTVLEAKYKSMHKNVQRAVRRDKRRHIDLLASEAENAAQVGDTRTVYKITKQLVDRNMTVQHPVKDKNGNLLNTDEEQLARWRQHFSDLLNTVIDPTQHQQHQDHLQNHQANARIRTTTPSISEISATIKQLPNGKAAGIDGIPSEIYKADSTLSAEILFPLITQVWEQESFPSEWKDGIMVKIAKKGNLKDCNNWRGICVLPAISKIIAKIILNRIKEHLENTITSAQAGFRSGFSCADHINTIRIIIEQCVEHNSTLNLLFIDFEKAFDSINRNCIWNALRKRGIPSKLIALIKESYNDANCYVLHKGKLSEPFQVLSGVRQGCILSPLLFLLVIEDVLTSTSFQRRGVQWRIDNSFLNYLAYADDICLLSHRVRDLEMSMVDLQSKLDGTGLKINTTKTKGLSIQNNSPASINVGDNNYAIVNEFCYLGSMITADGGTEIDVEAKISRARAAFGILAPIWQNSNISLRTKLRIFESNVKSVLLYGCTTWKVTSIITSRLQTFVNRCLRRILRIFWPNVVSNIELLRKSNQIDVATEIRKRKWQWIGHTLRRPDENIAKHALRWNPFHQAGRRVGRPKITWRRSTEAEMRSVGLTWNEARNVAQNRVRWRTIVGALCSSGS